MNRRDVLKTSSLFLGYTITGGTAIAVLNGCAPDKSPSWTPKYFSLSQLDLISELAEMIIPKTDTPGAKDAQVERFLDSSLECYPEEERSMMLEGLGVFDVKSQSKFQKDFVKCTVEQRKEILDEIIESEGEEADIFNGIKEGVVVGYCWSEPGATEFLKFDPIPGPQFQGCIDFDEIGTAWAL